MNESSLLEACRRRSSELGCWKYCLFDEIDSTNSEAKRMALQGETQTALIFADAQTNGRGRRGRSFYSPPGTGLYFSILFRSAHPIREVLTVTSASAVCVMRAIRRLLGISCGIKWVNDLYLNGKKVCGILAESVLDTASRENCFILGIGINLSTEIFPSELSSIAGCIDPSSGLSREELLAEILAELLPYLKDPTDTSWLEDYRRASTVLGKSVTWETEGKCYDGVAVDISADGALLVRSSDGKEKSLATGEITLRRTEDPAS